MTRKVVAPRSRAQHVIKVKHTVKPRAKRKCKEVVVPVEKVSTWNKYVPVPHVKCILVYAGEHTAFCIREFNNMESLAKFVASSQLRLDEYAVVTGTVKRCDPRYKPDTAHRLPWDDGAEPDVSQPGEEMCTTSQPLTMEETKRLLGG